MCIHMDQKKTRFLELPDLCVLECGVNIEKYQYFLPLHSINSRKSLSQDDEPLFGSLVCFGRTRDRTEAIRTLEEYSVKRGGNPAGTDNSAENIMRDKVTDCLKNKNTLNPVQRLMDLGFRVHE